MNIDIFLKQLETLKANTQIHYWPNLVAKLETISLRNLFLRALLFGLMLSIPWQCSRLIYNTYFSESPDVQIDHSTTLTRPNQTTDSITQMPHPKARRVTSQTASPIVAPSSVPADNSPSVVEPHALTVQNQEPKIIHQVAPTYPLEALRNNESGTVQLRVNIDNEGKPTDVVVEHSSGSRSLDRAAKTALSQWRFSPKLENAIAVTSEILIPIEFKAEQ
jgi:TonB family protein